MLNKILMGVVCGYLYTSLVQPTGQVLLLSFIVHFEPVDNHLRNPVGNTAASGCTMPSYGGKNGPL